jgi:hypothetical protein
MLRRGLWGGEDIVASHPMFNPRGPVPMGANQYLLFLADIACLPDSFF